MFYTPGGLKIRIPVDQAFSLIARLHPSRKGIDVLRSTDGLDKFPSFLTNIAVLVLLWLKVSTWLVIVGAVAATVVCTVVVVIGVFSGVTSSITWRLHKIMPDVIRWFVVYALSFWLLGTDGLKITFFSLLAAYIVNLILELLIAPIFKMTISELEFFRAFQYHARRLSIDSSVPASEKEIESGRWVIPFREYASVVPTRIPQEQLQLIDDAANHTI